MSLPRVQAGRHHAAAFIAIAAILATFLSTIALSGMPAYASDGEDGVSASPSVSPSVSPSEEPTVEPSVSPSAESETDDEELASPNFLAHISAFVLSSVPAGNVESGSVVWGLSTELRSAATGRPNPLPASYVAPASFDETSRLATWGAGSGTVNSDGSASLAFQGTSVNFAKTGGGWIKLTDPQVELDADGNGTVSAVVTYGTAPGAYPNIVFDPDQTPARGPERVNVMLLTGNDSPAVQDTTSVTWTGLAGQWHADFLAYLAGDATAEPTIGAWDYASWITNTGADARKALPLTIELGITPPTHVPTTYDTGSVVWGLSTELRSAATGRPNPLPASYVAPASFDETSRLATWGAGSGTVNSDGSASLAFQGTSVNFAKTGGGWIKLTDPQVELDADGNGTVSAVVTYGTAPGAYPNIVFDPDQTPARGPERVNVMLLTGNDSPAVQDTTSVTWTGLAGQWHADFLAYLAGDATAEPTIGAWDYASWITNTGADARKALPLTIELGITPPIEAVTPAVTLGASPAGGVVQGGSVTLTSTVTPAAAGTVQFKNGSTVLGTVSVTDTTNTAVLSVSNLPVGVHSLVAVFTPTDDVLFTNASSPAVSYEVFAPVVATPGFLSWGVKDSFRAYITTTAHGTVTTSGGAGAVGGVYRFPQSAGGTYDTATGLGSANYRGAVAFSGHDGALELTLTNPVVRVTGASSAVLSVVASGSGRIDIATLNLAAGGRSVDSTGAVTYTNVPAVLTAAGASAFSGFYSAGEILDPLSFVIGSAAAGLGGGVVASPTSSVAVPSTPPATDGIVLDDETLALLLAGQTVTITVDGFEPGEQVAVVLYSTPTVLARVTASAAGVATWTGSLPAGTVGSHTLVLIGSKNAKGLAFTVDTAAPGMCVAPDADLAWGFKASFLAYLDSTIAHGGWEVSGDVTDNGGLFTWAHGTGSFDEGPVGAVAFDGAVRFTGHDGALDTTMANPQVIFTAQGAVLLLDVAGETQGGTTVDEQGVRFADLDLAAATVTFADGVVTYADIPAVLTADGSAAFGTYGEGEELESLTLSIASENDCFAVLAGFAEAQPEPEVSASPSPSATPDAPATDTNGGLAPWLVWALVALGAIVALLVVVSVVRRRGAAKE